MAGRRHVTSDAVFAAYIEQEVFILFRSPNQLVLSAGHSGATDFYLVSGGSTFNLTGTAPSLLSATPTSLGSGLTAESSQPFQIGTLTPRRAVSTSSGLILIAADGFAGQPGVVGASAETGATVFKELGLDEAGDFFELDGDTYFVARTSVSGFELFRETGAALERVGDGRTDERPRLLAHGTERAFVDLPGRGLLGLRSGGEAALIAGGDLDGSIVLAPFGDRLVLSREGEYAVVDLETLIETPLSEVPPFSGEVVAVRTWSPRGDVDGDDTVTARDVSALLAYLFRGASLPDPLAADANGDGVIDPSDVDIILRHLWGRDAWRGL
ncbi:MAG: dockerin type I repeat-containing protein, partial [Actinobacteria bacterium]|nr:dockerin type I repeat-containing protein [Actinomycetota bacterium]